MKYAGYTWNSLRRSPLRAGLTILSVAVAVFLFTAVLSLDRGLDRMLEKSARPDVLVVFDKFQSCPPLSKLPSAHQAAIGQIDGVREVAGELFVVSSCSRATDLIAVHGFEPDKFRDFRSIDIPDGDYAAFSAERGAAIVGSRAAARYGWTLGQTVSLERLNGLTFTIRGIFSAPGESLENAVVVDLEYLRLATGQPGIVTNYQVRLREPGSATRLAPMIDSLFSGSIAPTKTADQRAFVQSAVSGLADLVKFSALLGYGALGLIVLGVGNSLSMGIRDRTREIALLKVTGFRRPQVFRLMIWEAAACGLVGGLLGVGVAATLIPASHFTLSVEGFTFAPYLSATLFVEGIGLAGLLAVVAGFLPARRVAHLPVGRALREVD